MSGGGRVSVHVEQKGTAMQRQGQDDPSSTRLEQDEGLDDDPPTSPQLPSPQPPPRQIPSPQLPSPHRGTEPDLNRYEEEEVATVPWPPPPPSHPHNIEA